MTNDWQERKGLIVTLGVVSLAVWGYNAYTVANAASVEPDVALAAVAAEASVPPHYADPGRDPFSPPSYVDLTPPAEDTVGYAWDLLPDPEGAIAEAKETAGPLSDEDDRAEMLPRDVPAPPPSLGPPPYTFAGVVGQTALLQDQSGTSISVRAGETIAGFRVARVGLDDVTLADGPRTYTLGLFPSTALP